MRCVSAGTVRHEETSHYAINEVFQYIEESFTRPTPGDAGKTLCIRLLHTMALQCIVCILVLSHLVVGHISQYSPVLVRRLN